VVLGIQTEEETVAATSCVEGYFGRAEGEKGRLPNGDK
jgi:hypothetical protein